MGTKEMRIMTTIRTWMDQFMAKDEQNLNEIKGALEVLRKDNLFNENYPELSTYTLMIEQELTHR